MRRQVFTEILQYTARAGCIVAVASFGVLAQSAANPSPAVELVPFDRFVADIANALSSAAVADTSNAALRRAVPARVANDAALTEMRRHVLDLYQGVHVTRSFLQGALTFDCIPAEQQPSVRLLGVKEIAATPPPYEMTASAPSEGVAAVRQEFRAAA